MFESGRGWVQCDASSELVGAYDEKLCAFHKEKNVMWLPVPLQTKFCQNKPQDEHRPSDPVLTSDVVLWLFELRHRTHVYDSLDHSELSLDLCDDSVCICRESLEYLQVESRFKDTHMCSDGVRKRHPLSVDDDVRVASYVSLVPGSRSGSQVSDVQLISLHNTSVTSYSSCSSSDTIQNNSMDENVEQQSQAGVDKEVCKNNVASSQNIYKPSVSEEEKNIGRLTWQANPVYHGVATVLGENETNTLVAGGGDAKLRKLSEEGVVALGRVMDVVSAVQDVDRCSHPNTQCCAVGNFPVDNDRLIKAAEHYDNVNFYHEATSDNVAVASCVLKNKTEGIKNVILQNEVDIVRGIYCIQESAVDPLELSVNCGDPHECGDDLVVSENISLEHCGNFVSDHVSESGSIDEISYVSCVSVLECEDVKKNLNGVSSVADSVETKSNCSNLCNFCAKLSGNPGVNNVLNVLNENCEVLLKQFQDIVVTLESMDGVCHPDEVISVLEEEPDLNRIFVEVENLADEVLEECDSHSKIVKELPQKKSHVVSCTSSDLSDDVFLNSAGSEYTDSEFNFTAEPHTPCSEQRRDINSIFDDGIRPPVRPERKKLKVKLRRTQSVDDEGESENNGSKVNYSEHFSVKDSEDLLLLQKVSLSSKEKRSLHTLSLYEDADTCCGGNSEAHTCNIVSLTPECGRNESFVVGNDVCPLLNSVLLDKPHVVENINTDMLQQLKQEVSSDECCSPHYLNENFRELLDVYVPQVKSISSCQFPPEDVDEIRPEHLLPMQPTDEVPSNQGEDNAPEEGYFSVDSHRSRKGSGSSDIAAWKQELQKSVLSWFDDESENEWFSSLDSEGRVYYFEENSSESSWALPSTDTISFNKAQDSTPTIEMPRNENVKKKREQVLKSLDNGEDLQLRHKQMFTEDIVEEIRSHGRVSKSRSMVLFDPKHKSGFLKSSTTSDWPQLWRGDMNVLKEGPLNRTKITENGKRLRKNWSPAYVVLTELFLLFFKDTKAFAAMKNSSNSSGGSPVHPELSVDLNGALIDHASKESSRKNVFIISTVLGLQVLLQSDNSQLAEKWYEEIDRAIKNLPSGYDRCTRSKLLQEKSEYFRSYSPDDGKKPLHLIERSRSVKVRNKDGSSEDLSTSADERQTKIRDRLKKFFHRRPTKELLMKKGIYKDEPVFGRHLADVCSNESPPIPRFVQLCIEAIESREENMKTDGLYRASGNLSQVQKIRLQVDQNNLSVLDQEDDVHVLTGALKLFFRELKSPVIPFEFFNTALQASTNSNKKEKIHQFQMIVKKLPTENRCTLEFLLQHLLKVTKFHKSNRMHISNLAIVFGPTLMWPEEESLNMAFDLMQQNLVIECFLQEFDSIFR